MDKSQVLETIKLVREFSKQRKFSQTFDLIITLKALNLKKPEENIDLFINLPNICGKQPKICAMVGKELSEQAGVFDMVVQQEEFPKYAEKKLAKKLASEYDFFIAQANLMAQVATSFGKILGPRDKMPNPKAGAVVPPGADLEQLKQRLSKLIRLKTKKELIVKSSIAKESMKDEEIAENFLTAYNALTHSLPQEEGNIKQVFLKLTMSPAIMIGETKEQIESRIARKQEVKKEKQEKREKSASIKRTESISKKGMKNETRI